MSGPVAPRLCGCGCGAPVPRRYRPGHDAKHKSALCAAVAGQPGRAQASAADTLLDAGWGTWADPAALRSAAWRDRSGRATQAIDQVTRWQVDHHGVHHADRRCRRLTAAAREVGGTNAITRLASDRYVRFADADEATADRLQASWDQCTECTHAVDRLDYAEVQRIARQVVIDATMEPAVQAPSKAAQAGWQVEVDDDSGRLMTRRLDPLTRRVIGDPAPADLAA